ncbi:rab-GTPase-TBC domain-containing protein [Cokeromyces recurvatus]|uniref:rab-GTPase-TBC domain-containing protein n=1 Tax=Cokeromyces recurvatus TaxID=90255 RepID=UPI00221E7B9D|nr:rab-GTPase-TBC domain-containing protein [Cokeromyces recurvatus]KAI7904770.1 rab-GTPase-TBC domain-containing protein [Cokeromyces recurvatus]
MSFNNRDYDSIWCLENIESILSRKHRDLNSAENSLLLLRKTLLTNPCPPESRGKVWKLLLRITQISASKYIQLVERGPSSLDEKIRHDTFRTMTTDTNFLEHVSEDMLIRLLNAFVWENANCSNLSSSLTYVQGMNVIAAPFLMTMPEMEAYFSFSTFVSTWCPLYVHPNMKGVHCGLRLLDLCLRSLDPTLYGYLRGKNLSASTYAFAPVMTFSACTPPLSELLQLWDYMFAYGLHLNILFIIAQLALIRTELLKSPSPVNLLRVLPPLRAKEIINLTVSLCKNLSSGLYDKLVRHAYDESVANDLGLRHCSANWSDDQDDTEDLPAYMRDAVSMRK